MDETCLLEFESHIGGKNARVRIFPDRVEWDRVGEVSRGKALLGVATVGLSLAATGVRSKKGSSEMIPVKSLSSVTTEKDGFQMKVRLITSGSTIDMRVSKAEAQSIKETLTRLMLGTHPSQQTAGTDITSAPMPPTPPAGAPTAMPPPLGTLTPPAALQATHGPDIVEQIKKLAELRDLGIVTAEEFETKKAELLSRM